MTHAEISNNSQNKNKRTNNTAMRAVALATAIVCAVTMTGCGTMTGIPSHGGGKRFATEQRLVDASIRGTLKTIDVSPLKGKKVALIFDLISDEGGGTLNGGRLNIMGALSAGFVHSPVTTTNSAFQIFNVGESNTNYSNTSSGQSSTSAGTTYVTGNTNGTNTGTGTSTGNTNTTGSGTNTGTNSGTNTGTSSGTNTGTNSGTNTGTSSGTNTGTSSGTNTGTSSGTNTGTSSGTNTGTNTGTSSGSGTSSGGTTTTTGGTTTTQTDNGASTNTGTNSGTNSGTNTGTSSGTNTQTGSGSNTGTSSGTNTGTSSGSNTGTSSGTNTGTSSGTNTGTNSGTNTSTGNQNSTGTQNTSGTNNQNTTGVQNSVNNSTTDTNSSTQGGSNTTRGVVSPSPTKTETFTKGFDRKASLGAQYGGLGEYQNLQVPKSDASYLTGLVRSYLTLKGVQVVLPNDPSAEAVLYVSVGVFGIVRSRFDAFVLNQETVVAETAIEMYAIGRDGKILMRPRNSSHEAQYDENYLMWIGPFKTEARAQKGKGLLIDFSDVEEDDDTPPAVKVPKLEKKDSVKK